MSNIRLSRKLCAVVGGVLRGSHATLDALFQSAGAPGTPPLLSHGTKWKEWLFRAGQDPTVDSLAVLGNVLEEFMDIQPTDSLEHIAWESDRDRVVEALEEDGLRYYRGGRVLPTGSAPDKPTNVRVVSHNHSVAKPGTISELLEVVLNGLRRAMFPLSHRRKGAQQLSFTSEYDVQDLLHALLRPWIADIRPEEFTPSYAGACTRMDFLLPQHKIVIEVKFVRDIPHGKTIGQELIIDIDHYRCHPQCNELWCAVFDPNHHLVNAAGIKNDLEGERTTKEGTVKIRVFVL